MGRKIIIGALVICVFLSLSYCKYPERIQGSKEISSATVAAPEEDEVLLAAVPTAEEKVVNSVVAASGMIVPAEWVSLSFRRSGRVEEINIQEGDEVVAGERLVQLERTELEGAVAQAEAALATTKAQLALTQAMAREEELAAAQADLEAAQSDFVSAQADLARGEAGLRQLESGPRSEEIVSAKADMIRTSASLQQAQSRYDEIAWLPGIGASDEAMALWIASVDHEVAKANYEALVEGATADEIAIAQAEVDRAQAQVKGAQARVTRAQAQLDLLQAGASAEQVAVAAAQVAQSQVALDLAQAALDDSRLIAPFAGTIGALMVKEGEMVTVGQSVLTISDLKRLNVELTDVDEFDIVKVEEDQEVRVTFDALPELKLNGRVSRITPMPTFGQDGTTYTVTIELSERDPSLRWGMTAFVEIIVGP